MANRKISQFTTVTDITTVSGLAGYDATTNVQISGSALISSLQTNLYTPFGNNGDVLTIVGGAPAWAAAGAGSASTMQQVYTASNAATPNVIGATLTTADLDLKNKDVLIQANGPMELQTAIATPHDISLVSSQNVRLISSNDVANPGSIEISANTGEVVMQSLDKVYINGEDLITFTTSNSTTPYTVEIDASGTLLIQGDSGTSGQVLTSAGTGTQPSWQTVSSAASTLQQVLDSGNTADSNGNTGTIVLTNSAQNRTATYGNENITTDYTFGIDVNGSNNGISLDSDDGDITLSTAATKFVTLDGRAKVTGQSNQLDPGSGLTSSWTLMNSDYLLDGYNSTSAAGGDIRINSRGSLTMHTGNLTASTPGGALSIFARGNTASLSTIDGTTVGGDVTISSSSGDVIITGGENLVLTNAGLGTPTSGDYLVADGVSGGTTWFTDPKAFVTLTGSPTWVIRDGYNATWNIGAGSETLSITASNGDTGTLIVTATTGEITWPANSNWPDANEPTLTNGTDIFSFIYDGTNYYWSFGQNFGA